VWLDELARGAARPLTLGSPLDREWDRLAALGVDAVWLMGVWERSPAGIRISMASQALLGDFRRALPDFEERDNVGSPYCVRGYAVDAHLGGAEALAAARRGLAERGLRLILDFVPNHVASDHPWAVEHPEYFIPGSPEDVARDPKSFLARGERVFACGRDPFFPAWSDVLQLNAFHDGQRAAAAEALGRIAGQCDAVRCDMAMLLLNSVFERTWGERAGPKPGTDYWPRIIPGVRKNHPEFRFIAEAYWDLEWELQQQGFDYCYDKCLYDRLENGTAEAVRLHLCADPAYQDRLLRFIENHDEPRAAAAFPADKHRAAAVTALTLPGARLLHEGQLEGRRTRLPVFLARRPEEPPDGDLRAFYQRLLEALARGRYHQGTWRLCERSGRPDHSDQLNLVAWCWESSESFCVVVVNLSGVPSQSLVRVPIARLRGRAWTLHDVFTGAVSARHGDTLHDPGLQVDLPPWGFHFLIPG
jgi:glycosidase